MTVRRLCAADAADMARLMADAEVFPNLMQLPLPSVEMWRSRIEANAAPEPTGQLHLAAEVGGRVVGSAGLHPQMQVRRRHAAALGISVAAEAQGRGVGSALMQAICDYADNWAQLLRIELSVFVDNQRAIALYERFGFRHEGTHRAYAMRGGAYTDVFSMARLHPAPPSLATGLKNKAWLGSLAALAALAMPAAAVAQAAQPVQVISLDARLELPGHWFAVHGPAPAPALVLLHGCSGMYDRQGRLERRYVEMAGRLNQLGVHALVVDSLGPRGERELCTRAVGVRRVTQVQRRRDALSALQWLATQPGVDGSRIGLLGWSNGGSTVLAASNLQQAEVRAATVRPTLAVAYYPGCEAELQRGYRPAAPLLLLLGEADDWTAAAPCKALAAQGGPQVQYEAYPDAHHGFDGQAPLRLRADVPGGTHPGRGVHVGANPAARAAAALRLEQFIRQTWALP